MHKTNFKLERAKRSDNAHVFGCIVQANDAKQSVQVLFDVTCFTASDKQIEQT